jgi:hypothetical protein
MTRSARFSLHALVIAAYLLLTLVMTWPLALHWTTAIPGDSFDGWQNYWNLWWMKAALVERLQNPYYTDLLYSPTGVTLYFHTLNPFNGLWSLPIQLAWGLIPAYNALVLLSFTLSGYGAFLLTRWVIARPVAGAPKQGNSMAASTLAPFFAGVVFAFAPFHMAHLLGHMQVFSYQWLPFYVLCLLRAMDRRNAGKAWFSGALLAAGFLALAALCDWYFALYLILFTPLAVLLFRPKMRLEIGDWRLRTGGSSTISNLQSLISNLLVALTTGLAFVVLLSPLLLPMVREATQFSFMVRPAQDLYILSASVVDFLIPSRLHTLFRPESFTWPGNQIAPVSERTISIGFVALALALLALLRQRRRALFWAVAALCFLLLALGPKMHIGDITWQSIPEQPAPNTWSPYSLLNNLVPFMRISRSVSRFALMVQLCVAVLAGIGMAQVMSVRDWRLEIDAQRRISNLQSPISSFLLFASLTALLLFEYWVAPYPVSPPDTSAYYATLADQPVSPHAPAVLNLPMNYDRPGYLLYQTVHGRPLTVAYISRDDPRTLTERAPVLQHFRHLGPDILTSDPVALGQTVFADLGVGTVVLDRYKMPGGKEREYTEQLARSIFAGQTPEYEDERITVYNVNAPERPQPYLLLGPLHWGPALKDEDGAVIGRTIGDQPAGLSVRHAVGDGVLRVRYRSEDEVRVLDEAGQIFALLPPAPQGSEATISLADRNELSLATDAVGGAVIEAIELVEPSAAGQ